MMHVFTRVNILTYVIRLKSKRRAKRRLAVLNDVFSTIVGLSMSSKPLAADVDLMPIPIHKKKYITALFVTINSDKMLQL